MEDDKALEVIAMVAHEAIRAFCLANGDNSQKHWEDAPEWQREAAINGAMFALNGNGPEKQHEQWCKDKIKDGWVYGEVKDGNKKTHPCLVPYNQLPEFQKQKDAVFIAVVRSLAAALLD